MYNSSVALASLPNATYSTNSKLVLATHVKPQYIALLYYKALFCAAVTHEITCCKTGETC